MNKFYHFLQNYLLYGFILVLVLLLWSPPYLIRDCHIIIRILHELLSYNFMLWFLSLVLYIVFLVITPTLREKTLRRMANLQERDEREEYITGKAARATYLASLSLMLLLIFFSIFNINFSKLNSTDSQKAQHSISIGIHYNFFSEAAPKSSNDKLTTIFDTSQFSLSSATLVLILLAWQLLIFNYVARKERAKGTLEV